MGTRDSPPSLEVTQVSFPQVSSPPSPPRHITPHVPQGHVEQAQGPRDMYGLSPSDAVISSRTPRSPRDKGPPSWYPCLAVDRDHCKSVPGPHDPHDSPTPGLMPTLVSNTAVTHSGVPQLSRTRIPTSWVSRIDTHPVARTTARWILNARDPRLVGHSLKYIRPGAYPIEEGGFLHSPPSQEWRPTYNTIKSPAIWISPNKRRPICLSHTPRSLRPRGQDSQWNSPGHNRPRRWFAPTRTARRSLPSARSFATGHNQLCKAYLPFLEMSCSHSELLVPSSFFSDPASTNSRGNPSGTQPSALDMSL